MRPSTKADKSLRTSGLANPLAGSESPSPPPPPQPAFRKRPGHALAEDEDPAEPDTAADKTPQQEHQQQDDGEEEEEDDYMSMTFDDAATSASRPETSLQRRERLRREGLRRGQVPSKAELAARERERREEGLSRSLIPQSSSSSTSTSAVRRTATVSAANPKPASKGLAMMAKMGFKPGSALGAPGAASRIEPLRIEVREDRGGVGLEGERKRRLREELGDEADEAGTKKTKVVDEGDYRERMAREREAARAEKLVRAAQMIAERMDEDRRAVSGVTGEDGGERIAGRNQSANKPASSSSSAARPPLRAVPVLYRGLVRRREAAERDRRMRHDLEVSSGLPARLPTYEDETMDADDRLALGQSVMDNEGDEGAKKAAAVVYEEGDDDLDGQDEELDAFEALEPAERLRKLVEYLREQYRYCFWCKFAYPDEAMDGCPGLKEEDHD